MEKNVIKRLGMQKEFNLWLKDSKEKFKEIRVGDRVRLIDPPSDYESLRIKKGDKATVISIDGFLGNYDLNHSLITVRFDKHKYQTDLFGARFIKI